MSTTVDHQDKTMDDHTRWLRYKDLIKNNQISKKSIKDGTQIKIWISGMENADWDIVLEEISNKSSPLRELELRWPLSNDETIEPGFIKLTNAIATHTTLVNLQIQFADNTVIKNRLVPLYEALKNNRSIKYLSIRAEEFNLEMATAFAQMLMNNQTLIALCIDAFDHQKWEYDDDTERNYCYAQPLVPESIAVLSHSFQSTNLKQLRIHQINNEGFEVLVQSLPKTLTHLDLTQNQIDEDAISVINSYLKSNGSILQGLALDHKLMSEYLKQQELSSNIRSLTTNISL